jgi:tight adherence protein B
MVFLIYLILCISLSFIGLNIYAIGNMPSSTVRRRLMMLQKRAKGEISSRVHSRTNEMSVLERITERFLVLFRKIGVEISPQEVLIINLISYLAVFLLLFLASSNLILAFLLGSVGLIIPYGILSFVAIQRAKAFEKLFGDALYLMANTLKSGFSFRQALQIIAQEMPSPICDEFELLNQELNWGLPVPEAMLNLAKRMPNDYVNLFVTAISIQNEVGGSLSDILSKIAEAIRNKEELRGEIKVLTAQGKASGVIVGMLPFAISFFVFMVNPAYISQLFITPIGLFMVVAALTMEMVGVMAIKIIVNID